MTQKEIARNKEPTRYYFYDYSFIDSVIGNVKKGSLNLAYLNNEIVFSGYGDYIRCYSIIHIHPFEIARFKVTKWK